MDARSVVQGHYWDYSAPVLGASPNGVDEQEAQSMRVASNAASKGKYLEFLNLYEIKSMG